MGRTYQKSRLFLGLSVEDNLYLAVLGSRGGHQRLTRKAVDGEMRERARELAAPSASKAASRASWGRSPTASSASSRSPWRGPPSPS